MQQLFNFTLRCLLSRCEDNDVSRRIQDLTQTLTNEIQREQSCLQTINQLNSENAQFKVFRDLLVEINNNQQSAKVTSFIRV